MTDSHQAQIAGDVPAPHHPRLASMLNVQEVATILRCSPRTVYRLADARKMPSPCRLGALVRWPCSVIERWIAEGCPAGAPRRQRR